MRIEHKFLKHYPLHGKKILIIGTFNPDVACNKAESFYGRSRNFFWALLPLMFDEPSCKGDTKAQKAFLQKHRIELSDLILSVEMKEEDICSYGDDKLQNVIEYNTPNILKILACGNTKEVYFTRKSFDKSVEGIKSEIYKVKDFCDENGIKFRFLLTPARFPPNEKKIKQWKESFGQN